MISFEHVGKDYGGPCGRVFEDFNALIQQGEMILLTGKSGAGKTTLLKLILKETLPTEGRITVFGEDLDRLGKRELPFYRRNIGVILQEPSLVSRLNVYENVELARLAAGGSKKDNRTVISSLLRLTGISHLHKSCPEQLSGERNRESAWPGRLPIIRSFFWRMNPPEIFLPRNRGRS
ncbi:MAG: ATP-binding cassette domain-containing protein [Lachnospiraceae bacterium]|nr:ATP-binding cassette domain-containing protein [Lachnospiraceae bacterium]